jgi:hypothetical protein
MLSTFIWFTIGTRSGHFKYSKNYSCFIKDKTFLELHWSRLYFIIFHFLNLFSVYLKAVWEVSDLYIAEWHEIVKEDLERMRKEQVVTYF